MRDSREIILSRVRSALISEDTNMPENLGPTPEEILPQDADLMARFKERWLPGTGIFHLARSSKGLTMILTKILKPVAGKRVIVSESFKNLMPDFEDLAGRIDVGICENVEEFPSAEAGLTGAELALAYSGTIVVTSGSEFELTASVLPPIHVALIPRDKIKHHLGQAFDHLSKTNPPRAAVFISGPSKTGDIQMTLVHGVHGPGEVHAVILDY